MHARRRKPAYAVALAFVTIGWGDAFDGDGGCGDIRRDVPYCCRNDDGVGADAHRRADPHVPRCRTRPAAFADGSR